MSEPIPRSSPSTPPLRLTAAPAPPAALARLLQAVQEDLARPAPPQAAAAPAATGWRDLVDHRLPAEAHAGAAAEDFLRPAHDDESPDRDWTLED